MVIRFFACGGSWQTWPSRCRWIDDAPFGADGCETAAAAAAGRERSVGRCWVGASIGPPADAGVGRARLRRLGLHTPQRRHKTARLCEQGT
ncbi:MAG: hypothetical protein GY820_00705 [Gammaproteobacteria bacterium]|nr:hypothetical protein [Gammaproteobacteria bacterium]